MPVPVVGLAMGAGAVWLLSQLRGDARGSGSNGGGGGGGGATPGTTGVAPNTIGGGLSADEKWAAGVAIGSIPTVIGIATAIAKGVAGVAAGAGGATGTAGSAAAGATAGGKAGIAATGAATAGITSGLVVEAIGGSSILIGIVAILVTNAIVDALAAFAAASGNFVNSTGGPAARWFFDKFVAKVSTVSYAAGDNGKVTIALSNDTLRKIALTSFYLEYAGSKARNDALNQFYNATGTPIGNRPMWSPTGIIIQGGQFGQQAVNDFWGEFFGPHYAASIKNLFANVKCLAPNCDWNYLTAPISGPNEMEAAAHEILGDKFNSLVPMLQFQGVASALALGEQVIYTQGYYPGDAQFVTELGQIMVPGWSVATGTYWTTAKTQQGAVWLVDPVTGNRVAPAEIRRQWKMIISVKGMEVSPGVFAGGSFGRGRRLARFAGQAAGATPWVDNNSSQCWDGTQFVTCGQPAVTQTIQTGARVTPPTVLAANAISAQREQRNQQQRAASGGGLGGLLIPAGLGIVALLFFGGKRA